MEKGLDYQISDKYSHELNHIEEILDRIESKQVYDLSGVKMDGSLSTNASKLKKEIEDLLFKIQNGEDGTKDKIKKAFDQFGI